MRFLNTRVLGSSSVVVLGCAAALMIACSDGSSAGSRPDAAAENEAGNGMLSLSFNASEALSGFLLEVTNEAGDTVVRKLLESDGRASTFVSLPPGEYHLKSTPMRAANEPHPDCKPSSRSVTVRKGKTQAVSLLSQCQSPSTGGLGVDLGANFAPEITSAEVTPGTKLGACQHASVELAARDAESDELTCEAVLDDAEPQALDVLPASLNVASEPRQF